MQNPRLSSPDQYREKLKKSSEELLKRLRKVDEKRKKRVERAIKSAARKMSIQQ